MQENSILKLSLISSLVGAILIYAGGVHMKTGLTPISKIDKKFVGLKAEISGKIIDLESHPKGHIFLKVKDSSGGVIDIPIFSRVSSKMDEEIELLDTVQAAGEVKKYQGELELIPSGIDEINIIHSAPSDLSEINRTNIGSKAKIQGIVGTKKEVGNGNLLLEIEEDGNSLPVFIPKNTVQSKSLPDMREDQILRISGTVKLYEGEVELVVDDPRNIKVVEVRE